jgi:uncharacterized membrane protein YfcA
LGQCSYSLVNKGLFHLVLINFNRKNYVLDIFSDHSTTEWALAFFAAFIIGFSKAGLRGVDVMNVTIMALVFGSKASTGIVLPLLCLADILAVSYYNRHAQWGHFKKLMPWMIIGVLFGWYIGKDIDELLFKRIMAIIILTAVALLFWWERRNSDNIPKGWWFEGTVGLASGFTTMIGNLAGAFSNIYFLVLRFPKNEFIGTVSWLFLFINLFKVPFHIYSWETINTHSFKIDLVLVPAMLIGFLVGVSVVKKIKNDSYRKLILGLTLLGAVVIFFR